LRRYLRRFISMQSYLGETSPGQPRPAAPLEL
jgi:hypothetical protein